MLARHPLNPGFVWHDHTGPYSFCTDEQVASFDERGFFVLDGAFGGDELARVVDELDRFDAKVDSYLDRKGLERLSITEKGAITFAPLLTKASPVLVEFTRHPVLIGLARDLLGPDVNLYWDQSVYKKPEKPRRFPWHQDTGYKVTLPQDYLTCWIAVSDATIDNGCPVVAPGVHRAGTLAHDYIDPLGWECFDEPPVEPVTAAVDAGGIVVFSSLTPHLTGPNRTNDVRKAYIVQYARAVSEGHWIGNHTLTHSVPFGASDDRSLPEREIETTQELIGDLAHPDRWFRPYGQGGVIDRNLLSAAAVEHLVNGRYSVVLWTSVPRDWEDVDGWVDTCLADVDATDWSVVVVHDLPTGAMAQLPRLLDELSDRGVEVVQDFPESSVPIARGEIRWAVDHLVGAEP